MLPNKSSNSGAIKGVEVGEASFFLPPCLLDEEEYEAGPVFRDNELQALCLASLPPLVRLEARARPTRGCLYPPSVLHWSTALVFPSTAEFVAPFFLDSGEKTLSFHLE